MTAEEHLNQGSRLEVRMKRVYGLYQDHENRSTPEYMQKNEQDYENNSFYLWYFENLGCYAAFNRKDLPINRYWEKTQFLIIAALNF